MQILKILFALLATAFAPLAVGDDTGVDETLLRQFKTELWPRAYRTQDVVLLDQLLHDSFQLIDDQGAISSKQQELDRVAAEAWNPGNFEFRIERLHIYNGDTAIISGQGIASAYTYRSSNVLVKTEGRWQAVSSHVSGVTMRNSE